MGSRAVLPRHAELLHPFTRQSIERIRDILATTRSPASVSFDVRTGKYLYKGEGERIAGINAKKGLETGDQPREAAVLLPLMNFKRTELPTFSRHKYTHGAGDEDVVPGILLQVRASNMRMHAGEVRLA